MTPSPGASSAPYPPLPDLNSDGGGSQAPMPGGFMQTLMAAVGPVQQAVSGINAACQQIVQSGSVPGAEQICAQIVALAQQLTVMAMQQAAQPQMGGGASGSMGAPIAPPAGAPPVPVGM